MKVYLGQITSEQIMVPPYTSGILRSYVEQNPIIKDNIEWGKFLYHTDNGVDHLVENEIIDPDVVALSCYSWNMNRNIKIAKRVKEKYPNCLIIFGGPNIPETPFQMHDLEGFLSRMDAVDLMLMSEGEMAFEQILLMLINKDINWSAISGLYYRQDKGNFYLPSKIGLALLPKPIIIPSPYLAGYFDEIIEEIRARGREVICTTQTNRGCPYSCTFCIRGQDIRSKIRHLEINEVLREIEYIGAVSDGIRLADDNFGILPQDEMIADKIVEMSRIHKQFREFSVTWAKNSTDRVFNIAKIMSDHQMFANNGVTIALQSNTEKVLVAIKRKNISIDGFKKLQCKFQEEEIPTDIDIIMGLPEETIDSFLDSMEEVLVEKPTNVLCYVLNLNNNSEMSNQSVRDYYQFHIQWMTMYESPFAKDESEHYENVMGTKDISNEEMIWLLKWRDSLDFAYFGLWTYYISWFLKEDQNISLVDFNKALVDYGFANHDSIIGKCVKSWYIKNYNSGGFVSYKGPYSPHGVSWENVFFLKRTFHWLCISENRNQFYKELREIISNLIDINNVISEALQFQEQMMIKFDYDPAVGITFYYQFNWYEHFHLNHPLIDCQSKVQYISQTSGRDNVPIKPFDSDSMFSIAGGSLYKPQKTNTFIHRNAIITTNKISTEYYATLANKIKEV